MRKTRITVATVAMGIFLAIVIGFFNLNHHFDRNNSQRTESQAVNDMDKKSKAVDNPSDESQKQQSDSTLQPKESAVQPKQEPQKQETPVQESSSQKNLIQAHKEDHPVQQSQNQPAPKISQAVQPSPSPQKKSVADTGNPKQADDVLQLVNSERAKNSLPPLTIDPMLQKVAMMKVQDMRDQHYFDHQSPTYGSPFNLMTKVGVRYSYAGENIAAGQKTPADVMNSWMNSPGHRANILNENYTKIGIGYVTGGDYGSYWTQEFIRA